MDTSSSEFSISVTDEESDLTVVFNNNLKFFPIMWVTVYVHKANRVLRVIKQTFIQLKSAYYIDYFMLDPSWLC